MLDTGHETRRAITHYWVVSAWIFDSKKVSCTSLDAFTDAVFALVVAKPSPATVKLWTTESKLLPPDQVERKMIRAKDTKLRTAKTAMAVAARTPSLSPTAASSDSANLST